MKRVIHRVLLAGFLAGSATLVAAPFDGNKPMLCATQSVIQCDAGADCVTLTPESVNVPDFFQVDAGSTFGFELPLATAEREPMRRPRLNAVNCLTAN